MNAEAAIGRAEKQLRDAMLSNDVKALDSLLSDGMVFTNQNGIRLSKTDDIAAYQSGRLKIYRLDVGGDRLIRVLGDSGIVCVTIELAGAYDGQEFGGTFAYSRIWHRQGDRWRIEAAHCSPVGII